MDACAGHPREPRRRLARAGSFEQPRGRSGGGSEDHRVRVQVLGVGGGADGEPPARRRAPRARWTIAFVRTSAPEALATASGSAPTPGVSETKTGAGWRRVPPHRKESPPTACCCYQRRTVGGRRRLKQRGGRPRSGWRARAPRPRAVRAWPRKDRSSDRPMYTPPSSGSTSRSTTSTPRREPMYSVTDTSLGPPLPPVTQTRSWPAATPGKARPRRSRRARSRVGGHAYELPARAASASGKASPGVDGGRGDTSGHQVAAEADRGDQLDAFRPPGE